MPSTKKLLTATAGDDNLFVEDVFSNYLYAGSNGARTIANGISLSDEGGLVWVKNRGAVDSHVLFDTVNGPQKALVSNDTAAGSDYSSYLSFPSAGTAGWNLAGATLNGTGTTWASWSWRKAKGCFDVVTYTGNGLDNLVVSHNLGSVPKMIFFKRTDGGSTGWLVYHASQGNSKYGVLNHTQAFQAGGAVYFPSTPTSSSFEVGEGYNDGWINGSGMSYVAYVFGDDAIFGEDGDEQICKMGSYTDGGSSSDITVNLGWEPQWILLKNASSAANWWIFDTMRGWVGTFGQGSSQQALYANLNNAETSMTSNIKPTATGFVVKGNEFGSGTYIYMAIRRPMKVPEAGTEVFIANATSGVTNLSVGQFVTGFPVDLNINGKTTGSTKYVLDRLRGNGAYLATTAAGVAASPSATLMFNNGDASTVVDLYTNWWGAASGIISWSFKRAPKFMDTICYTGNGTGGATQAHNLTVVPELIMFKNTAGTGTGWISYWSTLGLGYYLLGFHSTAGIGTGSLLNNTAPTDSIITLSPELWNTNNNGEEYVAYLFATLAGVSKVGSYTGTGTGTTVDVDCGFSNGARLIIIRRTDAAGDWFIYDSVRGIVSGDDPYLLLNDTAAQVNTDYIDPLSSGFTVTTDAAVTSTLNVNNANYVFLAIA